MLKGVFSENNWLYRVALNISYIMGSLKGIKFGTPFEFLKWTAYGRNG